MAIGGRPNGRAYDEGDNVDEQNYGVLEEDGLDVRLVDNTPSHLRAVVDQIEYKGVDALRRALDVLNSMNIDINEAVEVVTRLCVVLVFMVNSLVGSFLTDGAWSDVKDGCEGIPQHDACLGGNKEVVQLLFSAVQSPHVIERMLETVESELGDTPLHHAAGADCSEVMRVMLELIPIGETRTGRPQLSCLPKVVKPEGFSMNSTATSPIGSSAISLLILVLEQLASSSSNETSNGQYVVSYYYRKDYRM